MDANTATVKHVPEWFPGASFQKTAKTWAKTLADTVEKPFQFVKGQMVRSFSIVWNSCLPVYVPGRGNS